MKKLNIPSPCSLIPRERRINAILDLYKNLKKSVSPEEIDAELDEIKKNIEDTKEGLDAGITKVEEEVSKANSSISTLGTKTSNLQSEVSKLSTKIDNFKPELETCTLTFEKLMGPTGSYITDDLYVSIGGTEYKFDKNYYRLKVKVVKNIPYTYKYILYDKVIWSGEITPTEDTTIDNWDYLRPKAENGNIQLLMRFTTLTLTRTESDVAPLIDWGNGYTTTVDVVGTATYKHPNPSIVTTKYFDVEVSNCSCITGLDGTDQSIAALWSIGSSAIAGLTFEDNTTLIAVGENIFKNDTKRTSFFRCFYDTSLGAIPEKLFAYCPEVTDFEYCFSNCWKLYTVPERTFANNAKVTDFKGCFAWCEEFLHRIPENLFANCPEVTNFNSCFEGCRGLVKDGIPEGLFAHNTKAQDFRYCFYDGASWRIDKVPKNLFTNCTEAEQMGCLFADSDLSRAYYPLVDHYVTSSDLLYYNCDLDELVCTSEVPPVISADAIEGNDDMVIYVPNEKALAEYKVASNWSAYADQMQVIPADYVY